MTMKIFSLYSNENFLQTLLYLKRLVKFFITTKTLYKNWRVKIT